MRELNGYRVSKGLRPVMEDRNLSNGSYNWSKHMYHVGRITHSHGPFEELVFRALGDYVDDPSSAINVWKSDPGVNANLLDPRARAGGIGFYIKDGWIYATYRYVR
nr:CAP domain-containing protein [Corynebacterium aquatimens]